MKMLIGIGNAAIDVTASVSSDDELHALGFKKGGCVFPSYHQALSLMDRLDSSINEPGGSAANVLSTYGALGGKGRFVGKVGQDEMGRLFTDSIIKFGIVYDTPPCDPGVLSTQIFTAITPDHERSFASYYGASHHISRADLEPTWFTIDTTLLIDGYMLMSNGGPDTLRYAIDLALENGSETVFMPSSLSVIEKRPDDIVYVQTHCDSIICNTFEAFALTETTTCESAVAEFRKKFKWGSITLGNEGALYFDADTIVVKPIPYIAQNIVNTNGAGDNFAGGFMFAKHHGYTIDDCLLLGQLCALDILKSNGPRPQGNLQNLLTKLHAAA